jgi:hypothetical protein
MLTLPQHRPLSFLKQHNRVASRKRRRVLKHEVVKPFFDGRGCVVSGRDPRHVLYFLFFVVQTRRKVPVSVVETCARTVSCSKNLTPPPSILRAMNSRGQGNLPVARSMVSSRRPLLLLHRALQHESFLDTVVISPRKGSAADHEHAINAREFWGAWALLAWVVGSILIENAVKMDD